MKKFEISGAASVGLWVFLLAAIGGYISNIVQLVSGYSTMGGGEVIVRALGTVVGPLGAIMGFF